MHQISDGERRRVQLCMGLMGNWDVLLLDEVTVDLDVLVRSELLAFLIQESETRNATIVCGCCAVPRAQHFGRSHCADADATHIFDGLQAFPTHIAHLRLGRTPNPLMSWPAAASDVPGALVKASPQLARYSDLLGIALEWLKEDREVRRRTEKEKGAKQRGARKGDVSSARADAQAERGRS